MAKERMCGTGSPAQPVENGSVRSKEGRAARRPGRWEPSTKGIYYSAASIHSAAPRHSLSRCSARKKPRWPILAAPTSVGAMVRISGLIEVNPEHSNSTAGRVAQGSSARERAHRAPVVRKILQCAEIWIVEQIARAHHPARPLLENALGQILAQTAPAGRITQQPGEGEADEIQDGVDAVTFRRGHQLPGPGLRRDQQRARNLGVVGQKSQRLAAKGMSDIVERRDL